MTHPLLRDSIIALLGVGLLAACGNDHAEQKEKTKGVFTPYVEAHNEAKETASALNEAMQLQEQRIEQRD